MPLPPAAVAGAKTALRSLLATDSVNGRAIIDGDPARAWNFDSASLSSVSMPSPFAPPNLISKASAPSVFCSGKPAAVAGSEAAQEALETTTKLITFDGLKKMIEQRCGCKFCGSPVILQQETYGLATNLYLTCVPSDRRNKVHKYDFKSDTIGGVPAPSTASDASDDRRRVAKDNAGRYMINHLLVLAMHQLALGIVSVTTILATLGIRSGIGNNRIWKVIQDRVGVAEQAVKEEVLAENRVRAIQAALAFGATRDNDGRVGLTCSLDGGWQKRSSGRTYNSNSGHNLLVDCRTKLILDCVVYSKICSLCRRRSKKDDHLAAAGDDDVVDIDVADLDDAQTSTVDDDDDDDDDAVDDDAEDDDETTMTRRRRPTVLIAAPKTSQDRLSQWSLLVLWSLLQDPITAMNIG